MRRTLCWLTILLPMSCRGPAEPPPIPHAPGFARIEWLLGHGTLLNAVDMSRSGAGVAVGEFGAVLVTSDTGVTWRSSESTTGASLRAVTFADDTTAVALGDGGVLVRSGDNGRTWSPVASGSSADLRGVAFASPLIGLVVGDGGAVLRTEDGGRAWMAAPSGTTATLRAVRMTTTGIAIAAGDDGTVIRSEDGGRTWTGIPRRTREAIRALHFVTPAIVIAAGGDDKRWRAERVVLRSADGGVTWTSVAVPGGRRLYALTGAGARIVALGERRTQIHSADSGMTWDAREPQNAPPPGTGGWFAGVARGGGAFVAVTYGGTILRSADTGSTWRATQSSRMPGSATAIALAADGALIVGIGTAILRSERAGPFERMITAVDRLVMSVRFVDSLSGIAVGGRGAIQRTTDAGRTWTKVESSTGSALSSVAFADRRHGVAVASQAGTGPRMLHTEDGGFSWHPVACDRCDETRFTGVALHANGFGLAVGADIRLGDGPNIGMVFRTRDHGRTWVRLANTRTRGVLQTVTLLDSATAIVVGQLGVILHSLDGADTWTRRDSGTPLQLNGVAFADSARGVIVGHAGTILTTADGGRTWRKELARTTHLLLGVTFDASGDAVITGARGVVMRFRWGARTPDSASASLTG